MDKEKSINNKNKNKNKVDKTKTKKEVNNFNVNMNTKKTPLQLLLITLVIVVILIIAGFVIRHIKESGLVIVGNIENPEITIHTSMGNIKAELYPEKAPNTVKNIIKLAQNGYYDNKIIYGQDPVSIHLGRQKDGTQAPITTSMIDKDIVTGSDKDFQYTIKGEFVKNGFTDNDIKHDRYVLSIARADYTKFFEQLTAESYNSGGAEILIIRGGKDGKVAAGLDGYYSAFGKIIEGTDIIDKMEKLELLGVKEKKVAIDNEKDEEKKKKMLTEFARTLMDLNAYEKPIVINKITVDTKGVNYSVPEYIKAFDIQEYTVQKYAPKNEGKTMRVR